MGGENASLDFRLKETNEEKNILGEMKHNKLLSKKHKKTCSTLNYIEHLLILASPLTASVLNSTFAFLDGFPLGTTSSAVGLEALTITAWVKRINQ